MGKVKKNLEYQILQLILQEKNNYQIIKYFKETDKTIDKKKINNIRKNGSWYIDVMTNELVFTEKKISIEEQIFHYLYKVLKEKENKYGRTSTISNRKIHKRIALWIALNGEFETEEEREKIISRCDKWLKKETKLVGYDKEIKEILREISVLKDVFDETEVTLFSESYIYDKETGYPRGYGLSYSDLYLKPYLLHKSLECIKEYIGFAGNDTEYQEMMRKKLRSKIIAKEKESLREPGLENKLYLDYAVEQIQEKPGVIEGQYKNQRRKSQEFNTKTLLINKLFLPIAMEIGKWGKEMLKKGYSIEDIYARLERRCNRENITVDRGTIDLDLFENDVPRIVYTNLKAYNDNTINKEMKKKVEETFITFN